MNNIIAMTGSIGLDKEDCIRIILVSILLFLLAGMIFNQALKYRRTLTLKFWFSIILLYSAVPFSLISLSTCGDIRGWFWMLLLASVIIIYRSKRVYLRKVFRWEVIMITFTLFVYFSIYLFKII